MNLAPIYRLLYSICIMVFCDHSSHDYLVSMKWGRQGYFALSGHVHHHWMHSCFFGEETFHPGQSPLESIACCCSFAYTVDTVYCTKKCIFQRPLSANDSRYVPGLLSYDYAEEHQVGSSMRYYVAHAALLFTRVSSRTTAELYRALMEMYVLLRCSTRVARGK